MDSYFTIAVNRNIVNKGDLKIHGWHNETHNLQSFIDLIKMGYTFSPGVLREGYKNGKKPGEADTEMAFLVGVDVDNGPGLDGVIGDGFVRDNAMLVYTTCSHTAENNKYRIVFKPKDCIGGSQEYSRVAGRLREICEGDFTTDICRAFYGNTNAQIYEFGNELDISALMYEEKSKQKNGERLHTLEDIREMLSVIPRKPGYLHWLNIVSAIANFLPEEQAVAVINEWSPDEEKGTKYKVQHALKDFTIGTLVYYAMQYGYEFKDKKTPPQKIIEKLKPIKVEEMKSEIENLYDVGHPAPAYLGYSRMDDHFGWFLGQLSVFTGIPGHGKTNLVANIITRLMQRHNWRIAVFNPEHAQSSHVSLLISIIMGKPFLKNRNNRMTRDEMEATYEFLNSHVFYIEPPDYKYTMKNIMELSRTAVEKNGVNMIILDPWNYILHDAGANLTKYIGDTLVMLKKFAKTNNVHYGIVAHPHKMAKKIGSGEFEEPTLYNISDSAHWNNIVDNGFIVYRKKKNNGAKLIIAKVREPWVGRTGTIHFEFDSGCGRFTEVAGNDKEGGQKFYGDKYLRDPDNPFYREEEDDEEAPF